MSLRVKMEKERQVLTFWQASLYLPPSAPYLLFTFSCHCGINEEKLVAAWIVKCHRASLHDFPSGPSFEVIVDSGVIPSGKVAIFVL